MRSIDKYVAPMEPFHVWRGGFTAEECDAIKQAGELAEFMKAKVGDGPDGRVDSEIRDTDIVWLEPTEENKWIFERMNLIAARINFDKFQMDLDRFDGFQYSKYKIDGHYDWHSDITIAPQNGLFRKISFSLALSDPNEYEGGDLLLASYMESKPAVLRPEKGDIVVFYSHVHHKVAPVTSGERITLVTWALGDKIR